MHFKTLCSLFVFSLLLFSCKVSDEMPPDDSPTPVLGSAIFTVVNCTDTGADPTCTSSFDVLAASKIFLYTSADDREVNDPIFAEKLTGGEGTAEFSNLEGGDYFYTVQYPTDATVILENAFSIANGSRSQIRVEFEEEE
jgi:hypothetical protein